MLQCGYVHARMQLLRAMLRSYHLPSTLTLAHYIAQMTWRMLLLSMEPPLSLSTKRMVCGSVDVHGE